MNKSVPRHGGNSFIYTLLACCFIVVSGLAVASSQSEGPTIQYSSSLETSDAMPRGRMEKMSVQSGKKKMRSESASWSAERIGAQPASQPMSLSSSDRENLESVTTTLGSTVLNALRQEQQEGNNDEAPGVAQMLVHTGSISLDFPPESKNVGTVHDIANRIETIVRVDGKGYTESRSQRSQYVTQHVHMTVRVANAEFGAVMNQLQTLTAGLGGTVERLETNSKDVTDEYVDSTARADTLAAARKAMEGILARADKVTDVLEIQRELNSLMQQEESLRKRALQLKGSSDMSTIGLTLTQNVRGSGIGEDSPWHPKIAMGLAVEHVSIVVRFVVDTLSYAMVWLLPVAVLVIVFRTYKLCAKG